MFLTCVELLFGCCRARSQLSYEHKIAPQLVRSAENEPRECLWVVWGSARSQRGALGWILCSFWGRKIELWSPIGRPGSKKYAIDYRLIYVWFLHAVKSAIFVLRECEWTGWGDFRVSFGLIFWRLRRPPDDPWSTFGSHWQTRWWKMNYLIDTTFKNYFS